MNRERKPKLVIGFNTTTAALAFEDTCKLGRLIPLPSEVKAGCGLAYCTNIEHEDEIEKLLQEKKIDYFAKQVVMLYL
ncbi:MAG: DUF3343 domain-containing protein [Firmicutes bacterium]|nr:DUF3343 domain-containing protein [Bacillota bacterium]